MAWMNEWCLKLKPNNKVGAYTYIKLRVWDLHVKTLTLAWEYNYMIEFLVRRWSKSLQKVVGEQTEKEQMERHFVP